MSGWIQAAMQQITIPDYMANNVAFIYIHLKKYEATMCVNLTLRKEWLLIM